MGREQQMRPTFERKSARARAKMIADEHGALERAYRFRHAVPVL